MCAIAHVVDEKRQSIEKLLFPRRDCISIPMLFYSHTDTHSNGIQSDKPLESKTQKKGKKYHLFCLNSLCHLPTGFVSIVYMCQPIVRSCVQSCTHWAICY